MMLTIIAALALVATFGALTGAWAVVGVAVLALIMCGLWMFYQRRKSWTTSYDDDDDDEVDLEAATKGLSYFDLKDLAGSVKHRPPLHEGVHPVGVYW